ncbi:MAG TPA: sulfate ABC transporter substrate-binding protein [Pirellulales bacterium]
MDRVMARRYFLFSAGFAAALAGVFTLGSAVGCGAANDGSHVELLNVSYDPTRELWKDLNAAFGKSYLESNKVNVKIRMSHGGSGSQARSIIDGNEADVATLALWADVDAIRSKGLIKDGWEARLPNESVPYYSTIVFVVRKGNPKGIKDWSDLVKGDVEIVTPSPKTSGNGKMSFVAAWQSVLHKGGTEAEALEFVREIYKRTPVLDSGARAATATFSQKQIGDVHLTWESEAALEVEEAKGELEVVFPPASIRADPPIVAVDSNVDRKKTREVAEAYLKFVYTPEGQAIVAKHFYRPIDPNVAAANEQKFPPVELFKVKTSGPEWQALQAKFFEDGAVFDQLFKPKS